MSDFQKSWGYRDSPLSAYVIYLKIHIQPILFL